MVYFMDNPKVPSMRTRGTTIGNLQEIVQDMSRNTGCSLNVLQPFSIDGPFKFAGVYLWNMLMFTGKQSQMTRGYLDMFRRWTDTSLHRALAERTTEAPWSQNARVQGTKNGDSGLKNLGRTWWNIVKPQKWGDPWGPDIHSWGTNSVYYIITDNCDEIRIPRMSYNIIFLF